MLRGLAIGFVAIESWPLATGAGQGAAGLRPPSDLQQAGEILRERSRSPVMSPLGPPEPDRRSSSSSSESSSTSADDADLGEDEDLAFLVAGADDVGLRAPPSDDERAVQGQKNFFLQHKKYGTLHAPNDDDGDRLKCNRLFTRSYMRVTGPFHFQWLRCVTCFGRDANADLLMSPSPVHSPE